MQDYWKKRMMLVIKMLWGRVRMLRLPRVFDARSSSLARIAVMFSDKVASLIPLILLG
jgi:hypothetical protein